MTHLHKGGGVDENVGKLCTIIVYSHFFRVLNPSVKVLQIVYKFSLKFAVRSYANDNGRGSGMQVTSIFGIRVRDSGEFRFHIGQLELFLKDLYENFISQDEIEMIYKELYQPVPIKVALGSKWVLREKQEEAKKFILEDDTSVSRSRLIAIPTGGGKTVVAMAAVAEIKQRTAVVILPTYIDKWVGDIKNCVDAKDKDIMVVVGGDRLKGLISMAKDGEYNSPFIIFSLSTLQNFFKAYEASDAKSIQEEYGCFPEELFGLLGIGPVVIDEAHQHIHLIYKFFNYTHVPKVIALSATFINSDPVVANIQRLMFPKELRFEKIKMKKYIKATAIAYYFKDLAKSKIRSTEPRSSHYSHTAFEKSIMKNITVRNNYLEMISDLTWVSFIKDYVKGDKLIIFAATKKLCSIITNHIKNKHPHMDVRRYIDKDPYENIIDADIRVTTIKSGGTAIDIPNLRTSIMTVSVSSPTANLQVLGRLRELKDRDVKFYYLYCEQIPKQVRYHYERKDLIKDRVLMLQELRYPIPI